MILLYGISFTHFPCWLGHLFSLGKKPVFKFSEWHRLLGPLVRFDLGARQMILISDPQVAHSIFVTEGEHTSSRAAGTYTYDIYGMGGRQDRYLFPHTFTSLNLLAPKMVDTYTNVIREEMANIATTLASITERDGSVDPMSTCHLATTNVILLTCFATRYPSSDDPKFLKLVDFVKGHLTRSSVMNDIGAIFPFLHWFDIIFRQDSKLRAFVKEYRDAPLQELIADARASDKPSMVKTVDQYKEQYNIDDWDIICFFSDIILAGTDTTAVTVTWALAILVKYPEIQANMQAEIDRFRENNGGRMPTFADRNEFPYMISVQKECMRYRATTPFGVPHVTTKDVTWNGYYIPQGSTLLSNMYTMHRSDSVYDDANEFIPERFLDNTNTMLAASNGRLQNRDHYNFGWGRRICPGTHLAEVEMFDMFVFIFGDYDVKPAEFDKHGHPVYPNVDTGLPGGVVTDPIPYQVRVVPRAKVEKFQEA
ncbi:cytochrome P450 [Lichtheimia hyalospora FSU 10163]|nr:cytochrome P450 [Lichtheimia hyalospora FSU 10163]